MPTSNTITMPQFSEFQVVTSTPDLLVLHEGAYSALGWMFIVGGAVALLVLCLKRSGSSRGSFLAVTAGMSAMLLLGIWIAGQEYSFSFMRSQSAVQIKMMWFGRPVSSRLLTYDRPPIAEVRRGPKGTPTLVLRFSDGSVQSLGFSTDRPGYSETAQIINQFLQKGSVFQ